jgi:hypothetical protein
MSRDNYDVPLFDMFRFQSTGSDPGALVAEFGRSTEESTGVSRRKPSGWKDPTNYFMKFVTYRRAYGQCVWDFNPFTRAVYSGVLGDQPRGIWNSLNRFNELVEEGNIFDASLRSSNLVKARVKLKKSDVNLGVAFAERKETAHLLGDTATRLAKSIRQLRHGNVRNAMNELGISSKRGEPRGSNVPQQWLGMQYGWKPLLSDVYGACSALEKAPAADWRVTTKAASKSTQGWTHQWTGLGAGLGSAKVENSNYTRLDALPGNELLGSLASLGITNPLLIVWERVPFSFLVDWALPIGDWLDSVDALLGYESCFYSSSDYTVCNWETRGVDDRLEDQRFKNDYRESKKLVRLYRETSDSVPLPTFPRIKDPTSLGHMANGLALLAGQFGRLGRLK